MHEEMFRGIQHLTPKSYCTKCIFRETLKCFVISQCDDTYLHDLFFRGLVALGATAPLGHEPFRYRVLI